jgi:hypothetical protein
MEEKILWDLVFTCIVICFASISLYALTRHLQRFIRARRAGTWVQGVVVGNDVISETKSPDLYTPLVEYKTREGVQVKAKSGLSTTRKLEAGTPVHIFYDPRNPSLFFYAKDRLTPAIMIVVAIVSVVALVSSIFRVLRLVGDL